MVVLSPAVYVWSTSLLDRASIAILRSDLTTATSSALRAARAGALDPAELGRAHRVRIRVLDGSFAVISDADHDVRAHWHRPLTDPWFGPEGRPEPGVWEPRLPPLPEREEVREAVQHGSGSACEVTAQGDLLICAEVRRLDDERWLHVQRSTARSARALYEDRFQMTQLTLSVLVFALLLTVWLATRWVRPIESLRDQALARTRGGSTEPLRVERSDELGEVADAFNTLLAAIAERNRANELFAADLAHELKNPIAAVRTATDALGSGRPVDPERAARLHRILDESGRRMQAVIDRFLDLARAEAGLADAHRVPVDVVALVDALLSGLRNDERFADVGFVREGPDHVEVPAASERLETALRNLLGNAASFATGRTPSEVRVRVALDDEGVTLEVSDTGPGIAPDDLPRVFERYFSRREGGTGLGLALAKAIVDAHGGELGVQSPPGSGAVFTVWLPRIGHAAEGPAR
jgi:signal transduction histidine kinase